MFIIKKHIKLIFCISLFIGISVDITSQKIKQNSKFLYLTFNPKNGKNNVSYLQLDKFPLFKNYYKFGSDTIIESNNKVYYFSRKDSFLYYDYSLEIGDTFYFKGAWEFGQQRKDTMRVDSLKMNILSDGKIYKHWYLNSSYQFQPVIWIEGLGEKSLGWYRYDLLFLNKPRLKSICINDTIVFWDKTFNGFEPNFVSSSCEYESLLNQNFIKKSNNLKIEIFPNPVKNDLHVEGIYSGHFKIFNILGQIVKEGRIENNINTNQLEKGIFIIVIENNSHFCYGRFEKS